MSRRVVLWRFVLGTKIQLTDEEANTNKSVINLQTVHYGNPHRKLNQNSEAANKKQTQAAPNPCVCNMLPHTAGA